MSRCLIALIACFAAAATAAPAWTWVDENGRRHYSDRPVPGATRIELPDSQVFTAPRTTSASRAGDANAGNGGSEAQAYTAFNIVSPTHQETLWNIGGNLTMTLEISPGLQAGHRLDAILDGERVEIGAQGSQLTIPEVYRGLHTVQAVIVDAARREVLRSLAITIMVQQTSILNPNNPNAGN